jgi:hypothetical protein
MGDYLVVTPSLDVDATKQSQLPLRSLPLEGTIAIGLLETDLTLVESMHLQSTGHTNSRAPAGLQIDNLSRGGELQGEAFPKGSSSSKPISINEIISGIAPTTKSLSRRCTAFANEPWPTPELSVSS